tara:strand:+ start:303 stop:464 length:162 start_codon:yes stop_codon:yes gene_type:complete
MKNVTDISFVQGRLMQNLLIQLQMINKGMEVPEFIKLQEIELNLELDNMKEAA